MQTNNFLVSIVVPTYKRPTLLKRAIDSLLNQTHKKIEIIVVDDNTINSEESKQVQDVINEYHNESILLIKTKGKIGGGPARNLGISKCNGEYVAFLDDDDEFLPSKISEQLLFMLHNDLDFSYQDIKWYNYDGKLVEYRKLNYVREFSKNEIIKQHILHSIAPTSIYMVKRTKLLLTEGFGDVKVGQDFILFLRCVEADMRIGYMPGSYTKQYLHENERLSTGLNKIIGENNLYEFKKKYFYLLNYREKRYVRFRHLAVISFSYLRSKRYLKSMFYFGITAIQYPILSFKEFIRFKKNRKN